MIGKEYINIIDNAHTAVLFVHGILGTPLHFCDLVPLVPKEFSVCNIVLDGHGKGVRDFSRTSMRKWEAQVNSAVETLAKTHENIIIVGHSMGTLLAIGAEALYSDKVKLLFLENVPLIPFAKPISMRHSYRVLFQKVRKDRPDEVAAQKAYGIEIDRRLWLYIGWVPRFLELFAKARKTKKLLPHITASCMCFQSEKDELVHNRSEKVLRRQSHITTHTLHTSTHYLYSEDDLKLITSAFVQECNKFRDK